MSGVANLMGAAEKKTAPLMSPLENRAAGFHSIDLTDRLN